MLPISVFHDESIGAIGFVVDAVIRKLEGGFMKGRGWRGER